MLLPNFLWLAQLTGLGCTFYTDEQTRSMSDTGEIRFVGRDEWGAAPPKYSYKQMAPEPTNMYQLWPTNTEQCKTKEDCSRIVRKLQRSHIKQDWPDIQFNFLIGGDGNVYEGLGWKNKVELDEDAVNKIVIALIIDNKDPKEDLVPLQKKGEDLLRWAQENKMMYQD